MANGLKPLLGLCALFLLGVSCSSDPDPEESAAAGAKATAASAGAGTTPTESQAGKGATASSAGRGGVAASAGMTATAGTHAAAGGAGNSGAAATGDPPPAVDGHSIYALECHGDSKDCSLATVPCFGVASPTPNVAAGWACANRCDSNADCSDAPSGAEAKASCVSFASAGHCVLVCKNENAAFACPEGMGCYIPPKSPIGYCLWQ